MFKKFSWGHGVAVALGSFIIFILFLIFVFSRGMNNSELVSDDYYHDELEYQQVINAKNNADGLTQKPLYVQDSRGITISFPKSIAPENEKTQFDLFRTDDSNLDVKKEVTLNSQQSFTVPKQVLTAGSYTLKLRWENNKIPYQIDYDVLWK